MTRPSIATWRAGVLIAVLYVAAIVLAMRRVGIVAVMLVCSGCVTAPNSNLAITIDLFSSHSRYGQSLGGTNTAIRGQIEGGGGNGARASVTP